LSVSKRRSRARGYARLFALHLVDCGARLIVHRPAARVEIVRHRHVGLVDRCLPRLEGVAIVTGLACFR
jgi:hypothetical protein